MEPHAHPQLVILGYADAAKFLRSPNGPHVRAVISIYGKDESAVIPAPIIKHLTLRFEDVDSNVSHHPGARPSGPTPEHAREIITFARQVQHLHGILLCCCKLGISRSTAAALLCLATWTAPGNELACAKQLKSLRKWSNPNEDLVRFGDQLLHRSGALVKAIHDCGMDDAVEWMHSPA